MPDLTWKEAIIQVLGGRTEAMHYTEIAEAIAEQGLRTEFGATPAATVNATIALSLQHDGEQSPFQRISRGEYILRAPGASQPVPPAEAPGEEGDETGLINAFGMYWARPNVLWTAKPKILGQQQPGSAPVDFYDERGVYLLHDGRAVVYVGRTTDQPLGARLRQHVNDRLNGRWDRFSWFGVYRVSESGALDTSAAARLTLRCSLLRWRHC